VTDIGEQGLEIGWQRIAGSMEISNHLVQIISKPDELRVDHSLRVVIHLGFDRRLNIPIEEHRAPEMNRAHAERGGALFDALQFACREA
jgi:hypothetical protein